ncbi:MAG: transposase, partial [Phycisphaerales bacterium]
FLLKRDSAKAVLVSLLAKWAERQGVLVHAFAILDNHFHLSATPPDDGALARVLGFAAQGLSRWLNVSMGDSGPNWQSRFYASPMDPSHAIAAARYIERNPVAAGLVKRAELWHWSSAAFHAGNGNRPRLLTDPSPAPGGHAPAEWARLLADGVPAPMADRIHGASSVNAMLGSDAWINVLESATGRRLRPRPRGRPRKSG